MSLDFEQARFTMVQQQVRPWEVADARVLEVLGTIKREDFVPTRHRRMAFADLALPLEHGQTMMKPVVEGRMLQALALDPRDEVLEVGTGGGFISFCLAALARDVVSIDIHADFVERSRARAVEAGISNLQVIHADAMAYRTARRFDAIAVTGAVDAVPAHFITWLKPGGRLFAVRGHTLVQTAVVLQADEHGRVREQSLFETELPYLVGAEPVARFAL